MKKKLTKKTTEGVGTPVEKGKCRKVLVREYMVGRQERGHWTEIDMSNDNHVKELMMILRRISEGLNDGEIVAFGGLA